VGWENKIGNRSFWDCIRIEIDCCDIQKKGELSDLHVNLKWNWEISKFWSDVGNEKIISMVNLKETAPLWIWNSFFSL
jgi:hypothetical protein